MFTAKYLCRLAALLITACLFANPAVSAEWPTKPVSIIVPYTPGGGADILARALSESLGRRWKQPVLVENKPGASEAIAASYVARAKGDGYTLFFASDIALETNPLLFSKLIYNPATDLAPITRLIEGPLVYVVKGDSPFVDVKRLVDAAQQQPGVIAYGTPGTGSSVHLAINWFGLVSKSQFNHVAYKGSAPAVLDVLANTIQFTAAPLSLVMPYIKDGSLRAIATTGSERSKMLPMVPTLSELGYPNSIYNFTFALVGPATMPPELANRIAQDIKLTMQDPVFASRYVEEYGYISAAERPEDFSRHLQSNRDNVKARVKAANVHLD